MRRKDQFDRDALHFAPFVLFPSSFPRNEFNKALRLQTVLNELMHKVRLIPQLEIFVHFCLLLNESSLFIRLLTTMNF